MSRPAPTGRPERENDGFMADLAGSRIRVLIATTMGPVEVLLLTEEDPVIGRSVVCIDGTTVTAGIDRDYNAFVVAPTGVIARLFQHSCFRLDVSAAIDAGSSWQLGVLAAHLLHANGRLAVEGDTPEATVLLTGSVRAVDLKVGAVASVPDKLELALAYFAANGIARAVFALPATNLAELTPAAIEAAHRSGVELLPLADLHRLAAALNAPFPGRGPAAAVDPGTARGPVASLADLLRKLSAVPNRLAGRPAMPLIVTVVAVVTALSGALVHLRRSPPPLPVAVAAMAGGATFDAARVPLVTDATRQRLIPGYAKASAPKALAISNDGDFHGIAVNAPDQPAAIELARERCERETTATHKRPCFIYAAGDRVLMDAARVPLPLPGEIVETPAGQRFGIADTPLAAMQQGRRLGEEYPIETRPKALAIGTRGDSVWGAMSTGATVAEAIRRSLEFCGFRAGPCILYAVGDELVTRPPQTRRIIGVLSFAAERTMPPTERQHIMAAYASGRDWQAVAHGGNGTWHFHAGAASEAAAIDGAMAKCAQADHTCAVYAIGRFRVAGTG